MRVILTLIAMLACLPVNDTAFAGDPMPLLPDLIAWADEQAEYMLRLAA